MNYLRFDNGQLLFTYNDKEYVIEGFDSWTAAAEDIKAQPDYTPQSFMCSSSVDFPDEYTDNQELIAVCEAVRAQP